MSKKKSFDYKEFVKTLHSIAPEVSSGRIVDFINKKDPNIRVTIRHIAAIKSNLTRKGI